MQRKLRSIKAILGGIFVLILTVVLQELMNQELTWENSNPSPLHQESETAYVLKVIDGDTIKVRLAEEEITVRIIGINTPEIVDPRKSVECFGKEASEAMKHRLDIESEIALVADPTQDNQDVYGRLLRYVERKDGEDIGLLLITEGFASEYTYRVPYERQMLYKNAESTAKEENRGLWGEVCSSATK